MLPAPMEPEILSWILADEAFEGGCESLGEDADVGGGAGELARVDDIFAADLVAEARPYAPGDSDGDGALCSIARSAIALWVEAG
jgi:hypothetical protein